VRIIDKMAKIDCFWVALGKQLEILDEDAINVKNIEKWYGSTVLALYNRREILKAFINQTKATQTCLK
jgi:hypothetical protein